MFHVEQRRRGTGGRARRARGTWRRVHGSGTSPGSRAGDGQSRPLASATHAARAASTAPVSVPTGSLSGPVGPCRCPVGRVSSRDARSGAGRGESEAATGASSPRSGGESDRPGPDPSPTAPRALACAGVPDPMCGRARVVSEALRAWLSGHLADRPGCRTVPGAPGCTRGFGGVVTRTWTRPRGRVGPRSAAAGLRRRVRPLRSDPLDAGRGPAPTLPRRSRDPENACDGPSGMRGPSRTRRRPFRRRARGSGAVCRSSG